MWPVYLLHENRSDIHWKHPMSSQRRAFSEGGERLTGRNLLLPLSLPSVLRFVSDIPVQRKGRLCRAGGRTRLLRLGRRASLLATNSDDLRERSDTELEPEKGVVLIAVKFLNILLLLYLTM